MEVSGTNHDNSNNNDYNASELSLIDSYDEDNNNNNNGRITKSLKTGEPSIKSEFDIVFNQNVPIHRDGKGLKM